MGDIVYTAGPVTGYSYADVVDWRKETTQFFEDHGIKVFCPMHGLEFLAKEENLKDQYHVTPLTTPKGILTRDRYGVQSCSVVLMNMLYATHVSSGSFIETGWIDSFRKPLFLVIQDEGNPNDYAMLNAIATHRYNNLVDARSEIITFLNK